MREFTGIDIAKEKFDIGWLRDVATGKKKTKVFKNTPAGRQQAADWLLKNLKVLAVDQTQHTDENRPKLVRAVTLEVDPEPLVPFGAACEMLHNATLVHDDLQDGDADAYLGHVPLALQINALAHLLCLVAARCQDLAVLLNMGSNADIVVAVYRIGATMLTGQRGEIMRAPWDIAEYEKVVEALKQKLESVKY